MQMKIQARVGSDSLSTEKNDRRGVEKLNRDGVKMMRAERAATSLAQIIVICIG